MSPEETAAKTPKSRVTAWEAIEILMGRIDKEFDRLEKDKTQSPEQEFDSMASKITQPFSIDKAIRG